MSFEVSTYEDLKKVGTGIDGWTLDADYIQTADINASASKTENPDGSGGYYGFEPIGTNTNKFTGIYDGQGHTISNLYINRPATDYIGLFGAINGEVSNLGLVDADITGNFGVGGLCGRNVGTITNCYSTGNVSGDDNVGGLCGRNFGTITNCYSTGSVTGSRAGGLCGYTYYGTITNCYSTGSVSGDSYVGGLCGYIYKGTITNCYSTGSVTGNFNIGGLCGINNSGTITNCYWNTETSGQSISSGGEGRTTAEMTYPYAENTYINWDFLNVWHNDIIGNNNGYPVLLVFIDKYIITKSATNITRNSAILQGKVVL